MSSTLRLQVILDAIDKASPALKRILSNSSKLSPGLRKAGEQMRGLQARINDVSAYRRQEAALATTGQQVTQATRRMRELDRAYAASDAPTKRMTETLRRQGAEVRRLMELQSRQRNGLNELGSSLGRAGINTTRLGSEQRRLQQQIDSTTASIERQGRNMERMDKLRGAADGVHRSGMLMAGHGMVGVMAGRRAFSAGAGALAAGANLESQLSAVQSVTRIEKDSAAMAALREQAEALGAATAYTAAQAAEGQFFLGRAGFTPEAVLASMPSMLNVARAGDTDLGRTADIVSNISSALGIDSSNEQAMTQLADQLVMAFTTSNTSLDTIGETMKYLAPIAKASNTSQQDALALAGMLGNIGIQGSMAGTAGRNIITRLAAPPKAASDALQSLGVTTTDRDGNLRSVTAIIADMDAQMKARDMGSAERLAIMNAVVGQRALAGMPELMEAMGSGKFSQYSDAILNSEGAAAKVAKTMADNLKGDTIELTSALEGLSVEAFKALGPWLRETAQQFTEITRSAIAWAQANPKLVATLGKAAAVLAAFAVVGGGVLVVLGTLGMFLGGTIKVVLGVVTAFGWLSGTALPAVGIAIRAVGMALMANPIGVLLGLIGALAVVIYRNWDFFGPWFSALWEGVKAAAAMAWDFLKAAFAWTPLGMLLANWQPILGFFAGLPGRFIQFGRDIIGGLISGIAGMAAKLSERLVGTVTGAVDRFKGVLGIRSPSRLFAGFGGDTMAGYAQGIAGSAGLPVARINALGDRLRHAGAGLALAGGIGIIPATAAPAVMPPVLPTLPAMAAPAVLAPEWPTLPAMAAPAVLAPVLPTLPAMAVPAVMPPVLPTLPAMAAPAVMPPVLPTLPAMAAPAVMQPVLPTLPAMAAPAVMQPVLPTLPAMAAPAVMPPLLPTLPAMAAPAVMQPVLPTLPAMAAPAVMQPVLPTLPAMAAPAVMQPVLPTLPAMAAPAVMPPLLPTLPAMAAPAVMQPVLPTLPPMTAPAVLAPEWPTLPAMAAPAVLTPELPALSAPGSRRPGATTPLETTHHYTIHLTVQGGGDAGDIKRAVREAIEQVERERGAQRRSRLSD